MQQGERIPRPRTAGSFNFRSYQWGSVYNIQARPRLPQEVGIGQRTFAGCPLIPFPPFSLFSPFPYALMFLLQRTTDH